MEQEFTLGLKVERRKAGLSQGDLAHLLGVHPSKVSLLESGKATPTVHEIALLAVVFGKTFEEFFHAFLVQAAEAVRLRLQTLPRPERRWLGSFNRQFTLNGLADRLETMRTAYGGS